MSRTETAGRTADGTPVRCTSHNEMYRDVLGRMRVEGEMVAVGKTGCSERLHTVTIIDPIASDEFIWVLQDGYVDPKHYMHMHIVLAKTDPPGPRVSGTANEGQLVGMDQVQGIPCQIRRLGASAPASSIVPGEQQANLVENCTSSEFGVLRTPR